MNDYKEFWWTRNFRGMLLLVCAGLLVLSVLLGATCSGDGRNLAPEGVQIHDLGRGFYYWELTTPDGKRHKFLSQYNSGTANTTVVELRD